MRRRVFQFAKVAFLVLVGSFLCWFVWEMYTQATVGPVIEERLGFTLGTPYVQGREVKTVDYVHPGKAFADAGFSEGDIIVDDLTLGQLYRRLDQAKGQTVTIHVVDGGAGPPVHDRDVRAVAVHVPRDDETKDR